MGQHTNLIRGFQCTARVTRGNLILRLVFFQMVLLATLISSNCSAAQVPAVQQASPEILTASPTEKRKVRVKPVDWIFIVDTSASMSGVGRGSTNIFPSVKETLREFVSVLRDEDTLTIFVFDSNSRLEIPETQTKSGADRAGIIERIAPLTAEGKWTHTGDALSKALTHVSSRSGPKRTAAIILLTDGKEDVSGIKDPIRIPDAIKLIPDENVPYVFYVSLGTALDPELLKFVDQINQRAKGHGRSIEIPGPGELREWTTQIGTTPIDEPSRPKIDPKSLDLGEVQPGGEGGPYSFDISSDTKTTLTLEPMGLPAECSIEGLPEKLEVDPRQAQRASFRVKLGSGATNGPKNFRILISTPSDLGLEPQYVPITLVVYESITTQIVNWLWAHLLLLLLILLIISTLLVLLFLARKWHYEGLTPLDIVRDFRRNSGGERTAVLKTPDGPIRLDKPKITLGRGGSKLPNSPATMEINREGAYHIVEVREGSVTITGPLHDVAESLEAGNKRRLKHNDRLAMPGYSSPIVYLHTARKH